MHNIIKPPPCLSQNQSLTRPFGVLQGFFSVTAVDASVCVCVCVHNQHPCKVKDEGMAEPQQIVKVS